MIDDIRKTKLRLEIDKTIQPKQFEPIKIQVSIEEEFCWENNKERNQKMQAYRDRILEDFVETFNQVLIKIGEEERCIGRVSPTKNNSTENDSKNDSDEEWSFD